MVGSNTVYKKLPTVLYSTGMSAEKVLKQSVKDGVVVKTDLNRTLRFPSNKKLQQLGIESVQCTNYNIDGNGRQFKTVAYLCNGFDNKDGLGVMFEPNQAAEIRKFFAWLNDCKSKGIIPTKSLAEAELNTKGSIL